MIVMTVIGGVMVIGHHPTVDVVSLFARHPQLLGTSPAHWAIQPIR